MLTALVTGLPDRLVDLSSGLALILAFIGVKLIHVTVPEPDNVQETE